MRHALKSVIPTIVVSLAVAACGSSYGSSRSSSQVSSAAVGTASSSAERTAGLKTAANATLGATVLVDAQGMTLYSLSGEENGKFICTSSCLQVWHPLRALAGTPGATVSSFGTVKRPDGIEQVTYRGKPLYTFTQDQKPGDVRGQGIKDVGTWTAVTVSTTSSSSAPAAAATGTAPAPATPPAQSGGSSRYGY